MSGSPTEDEDALYLALKGARERLCRASTLVADRVDQDLLSDAVRRIDLVGADLPQWSRHDGADPRRAEA